MTKTHCLSQFGLLVRAIPNLGSLNTLWHVGDIRANIQLRLIKEK